MRKALRVAAVLIVLALVVVVVLHTSPVRRYVLRRAMAGIQEQFGIRLEAGELRYDLIALRAELRDVRVAAGSASPFFVARRVSVQFPTSVLLGRMAIESLSIDEAHVRVLRAADGRTNLPSSKGDSGTSEPFRIGSLMARSLAIEIADAGTRSALLLPAVDATLSEETGRVHLRSPGYVTRGEMATRVHEVRGGAAFDGRAVRLSNLVLRTDELSAALSGSIVLLGEEPRVDIQLKTRADAARLARWAGPDVPARGEIVVGAAISGPFDAITAALTFDSPQLHVGSLSVDGIHGTAAVSPVMVRVDRLVAQFAGGDVAAAGILPLTGDGNASANVTWRGVDVEALARVLGPSIDPRPSGRADGELAAFGPPREPARWVAEAHADVSEGTTTRGRIGVAGRVHLNIARGRWVLDARERVSAGGIALRARAGGRIDFDDLDRSTIDGSVDVPRTDIGGLAAALRGAGLLTRQVGDVAGFVEAQAILSGRVGRPRVDLTADANLADVASLAAGSPLHGAASLNVRADLRTAHVKASLPDAHVFASAVVELQPPYAAHGQLTASGFVLDAVLRDVVPVPVRGTVTARAYGSGALARWQEASVDIEVDALDVMVGDLPVRLAAPARASVRSAIAEVLSLELDAGETRVSATGRLPLIDAAAALPDGPDALRITAAGDLDRFLATVAATRVVDLPDATGSGPVALLARIGGSAERPRISADVDLGPGSIQAAGLPPVTNLTMRMQSDGTRVDLRELGAEWQGAKVSARGSAPLDLRGGNAGDAVLTVRLASITPRVLEPFLDAATLAQLEGSIDATLEIRSPSLSLDDVAGEIRLDRMELRVADLPIAQREPTRVRIQNGFAEVASWQWTGQGGTAGLQGRVRLTDRRLALIADGRFDLRMLTPFTRAAGVSVAGTLEPRVSVTGTVDQPRVDGLMVVTGAEARLRNPSVVASNLDGRIVLTGTTAHITALSGAVNGGRLSASGTATYTQPGSIDATLSVEVSSMALEFPEGLRSEIDGDLRATVELPAGAEPSGRIGGSIAIVRSAYREPVAVAATLLAALRARRLAAAAVPGEPALADNLALDVRLTTGEADVVVDNNIGRFALSADLRVIGTVAAPALAGRARLAEGGQLYLGRNRYEITSGTIDFVNPVVIQPELNVVATTRAGGEDIELTITGPADGPEIEATSTSDPELTQAEVFSLLLTGRRLEEISGDEAEIVGEQALAFLSGDVLGFAGRAVGLDVIRLGGIEGSARGDLTTELDPTARLTFEKSIRRDLDVTFSQGLRESDAQTWIVDYRPRRQVEVRFVSNDESLRSLAFRHDVAFGGTSPASAPAAARRGDRRRPRVAAVTIAGARAVPEARLRQTLELEAGDEFDFAASQRDRDRLEALLRDEGFCEARVTARQEGDGPVTVTYSVVEGPRCSIDAGGYAAGADTIAEIRRAWSQSVFDEFLVEEARKIVTRRLARDGHLQADVQASLAAEGERKTLTIRIEPGPAASVRRVRFDGVQGAAADALQEWAAARSAGVEASEDPPAFERALTAWLRARGHARASVAVGAPLLEGTGAVVPVAVDAGPAYTISAVRVDGAHAFDTTEVVEAAGLSGGAAFDPAAVEAARDRLQAWYRRAGFTEANVAAQSRVDEQSGTVAIAFAVGEGPRQVLRDVTVAGNRTIDTDVIERALDLPVGEPVTLDDWLQARRRLFDTGLFRRADVAPEPLEARVSTAGETPMRARVVVEEWPAVRLRYGFQVAEERPEDEVTGRDVVPGLSADVTRRTLFGRALTIGGALDYQRREQRGRAFLSSPTMLGWPIESVFVIERSRESFASTDLATHLTGASWEQRVRAWNDVQLSYSYRFERNRTFRTTVRPGDDFGFDVTIKLAVLNATAAWDTRDEVADPSRGWLVSSSFDWAPAALGTDFRFVKHLAQAYYFQPWRHVVFASAARLGIAAPLEGQDLVLSERYYAGGARTVRGVEEDTLGPRFALGDPAGGESLLVLNQEVRFPIHRWLRGTAFVDAGNVFADASGIALRDLVSSYGAGLRIATPFALLRVDYGRLFSPSPGQASGRWTFGLGHAF